MALVLPIMGTMSTRERCPELDTPKIVILGKNAGMGNRIKELRLAAKLSQPALAALSGTTKNQIVKLESGARRLSDHWAQRLAPHLGVQPYELFMPSESMVDSLRLIPLVGVISCGDWQEAVEHPIGMVPAVNGGSRVFALRAQGDSMNKLIREDGYVYVDPDDRDLIDGKVYAVMNGSGETTAKQYRANPARLVPCSDNPAHKETVVGRDQFNVIGRIVGTYSPL
jgi:repressor LexA